jgi:hypothetical protein
MQHNVSARVKRKDLFSSPVLSLMWVHAIVGRKSLQKNVLVSRSMCT